MGRFVRPEPVPGSTRVTKVFDTEHVRHRACRVIDPATTDFEELKDRLRRLAKIRHPNLARMTAVGQERGQFMVLSEWVPGGRLEDSEIPNPGRLLAGVAEALYALHRQGLAHGSVSTRTLLLATETSVKIVDACIRDGSVREDLEGFGQALEGLYAGKAIPDEFKEIARKAQAGRYPDCVGLIEDLKRVCAQFPAVTATGERTLVQDTQVGPVDFGAWEPGDDAPAATRSPALLLLVALLPGLALVWFAALIGWWFGGTADGEEPVMVPGTGDDAAEARRP